MQSHVNPFPVMTSPLHPADGRTWPDVKHFLGEALDECHSPGGRGGEEMTPMMPKKRDRKFTHKNGDQFEICVPRGSARVSIRFDEFPQLSIFFHLG